MHYHSGYVCLYYYRDDNYLHCLIIACACSCWLNSNTNFILTFIVPVVIILLVNVGFFIMAIVIICRHQKRQGKRQEMRYVDMIQTQIMHCLKYVFLIQFLVEVVCVTGHCHGTDMDNWREQ